MVVKNANKRLADLGLRSMIEIRQLDVAKQKLPASDNIVDLCVTINLHQYFKPVHYEQLTREIHRILKPGGAYLSVIVTEVSVEHPSKRLLKGLHSQLSKIFQDFTDWWSVAHIRELYERVGFDMNTFEALLWYSGIQTLVVVKKP